MAPVIFARPGGIEQGIVCLTEIIPAFRVFPDPVFKSLLDCFLFLLGNSGLFRVQNVLLVPVGIFFPVKDPDGSQI